MSRHLKSDHERRRQAIIITRALHSPEGLSQYAFTKGMSKEDALQFWNDAKALGLVRIGTTPRGSRTFGLRSEACK